MLQQLTIKLNYVKPQLRNLQNWHKTQTTSNRDWAAPYCLWSTWLKIRKEPSTISIHSPLFLSWFRESIRHHTIRQLGDFSNQLAAFWFWAKDHLSRKELTLYARVAPILVCKRVSDFFRFELSVHRFFKRRCGLLTEERSGNKLIGFADQKQRGGRWVRYLEEKRNASIFGPTV
jgi:hypothetical protein